MARIKLSDDEIKKLKKIVDELKRKNKEIEEKMSEDRNQFDMTVKFQNEKISELMNNISTMNRSEPDSAIVMTKKFSD